MKNKILFLSVLFLTLNLIGCTIEESYTLQGVFINKLASESLVEAKDGKLKVEIPIIDFSCDIESFETSLEREQDTFVITLSGNETQERCKRNFDATVAEIQKGEYWVEVIYEKGDQEQEILNERFFMK